MNTNADNSASTSDATSTSGPQGDDGNFLEKEAAEAQAAFKRALEDLKASLAKGVDVRLWAKEHPLMMAALAAAAGFAAAEVAVPSKRQQELKRWIAIERAAAAVDGNGNGHKPQPPRPPEPSFLATLGKEALSAVRPLLVGLVTSAVAANQAKDESDDRYPPPADMPDNPYTA